MMVWSFLRASSGPAQVTMYLPYVGEPIAGCSTPGRVLSEGSRMGESPVSTYWFHFSWFSPGCNLLWAYLLVHNQVFHSPVPLRAELIHSLSLFLSVFYFSYKTNSLIMPKYVCAEGITDRLWQNFQKSCFNFVSLTITKEFLNPDHFFFCQTAWDGRILNYSITN